MRRAFCDLFLLVLCLCFGWGIVSYLQQFFGPIQDGRDIDLGLVHLPQYALFSLARGLAAYTLSLLFSLLCGFWAAKDRVAEKILIPFFDVLQSIPFLGFLPGVVLLFVNLFQTTNVGLELAAILLMFTSQVWNMIFSVYHAIRTVPSDKSECATAFRFSRFQRLRWVELPYAALSLIWNSIMSVAGGWFFLMINEAFTLGNRDFRIPGIGSYMSVAASHGDVHGMIHAIVAMIVVIVTLDQLLWRPLVVWSQRLRIEATTSTRESESWFLNVLKNAYCVALLRRVFQSMQGRNSAKKRDDKSRGVLLSRFFLCALIGLIAVAAFFLFQLLQTVGWQEWMHLIRMLLYTFVRVLLCVAIGTLIMLPLGLAIGLSEKWCRILEPIIQVGASFPATLLFPMFILLFHAWGIPLGYGSIFLMLLGSQWYVLFNVLAGTRAMPSDLREAARSFRFKRMLRFFYLYLPAIFPYLITGVMAASGGAWNATIVAEYVTFKHAVWTTPGIGSTISLAAQNNNFPLLTASVLLMVIVVVSINYTVWLRLYHYSEKRFALNE